MWSLFVFKRNIYCVIGVCVYLCSVERFRKYLIVYCEESVFDWEFNLLVFNVLWTTHEDGDEGSVDKKCNYYFKLNSSAILDISSLYLSFGFSNVFFASARIYSILSCLSFSLSFSFILLFRSLPLLFSFCFSLLFCYQSGRYTGEIILITCKAHNRTSL